MQQIRLCDVQASKIRMLPAILSLALYIYNKCAHELTLILEHVLSDPFARAIRCDDHNPATHVR